MARGGLALALFLVVGAAQAATLIHAYAERTLLAGFTTDNTVCMAP